MSKHFLVNLKAYASLVGAIATAEAAIYASPILAAVAAGATAIAVWRLPNADA